MRKVFWSFYPPTDEDWGELNRSALIALDASAILHAYRLSPEGSDAWLTLLESLDDRLWVPYQAALEYQRNRMSTVASQDSLISDIEAVVDRAWETLEEGFQKKRGAINRTRIVTWEDLEAALSKARRHFDQIVIDARAKQVDVDSAANATDAIHSRISSIMQNRVGPSPDESWLTKSIDEGRKRYAKLIPPGFEDAKKSNGDREFGDVLIWFQLLEHATQEGVPAVLITEERKRDWLRIESGRNLGPLPQLRAEFADATGHPFWLYSVAGLMRVADRYGHEVTMPAIKDAEQLEQDTQQPDQQQIFEVRVQSLIDALERLSDVEQVPDSILRSTVRETLSDWLEAEFESRRQGLTGPAAPS
jgi:hypothetical protein